MPRSTYALPGKKPPYLGSSHESVIESPKKITRFSFFAGEASLAFSSWYRAKAGQSLKRVSNRVICNFKSAQSNDDCVSWLASQVAPASINTAKINTNFISYLIILCHPQQNTLMY